MEVVLIKLVNNEKVIGVLMQNGYGLVVLFAPMKVEYNAAEDKYEFTQYEPMSSSSLGVFYSANVINTSLPKDMISALYEKKALEYYPRFDEYMTSFDEDMPKKSPRDSFDVDKLNDMFSEFLKPEDKKKLN